MPGLQEETFGEDPNVQEYEGFEKISNGLMQCDICRAALKRGQENARVHLEWHAGVDGS